ncbi:hypothetical protein L914_19438 [Phytophthora nicotianae]|uniref:Uncharacterized protein n=1 Tax=Phytophthora nicotianae TaxID=4792 RepID=W2MCF9_PHYNI|nr:hypothetical protein L914_19438 [Phytophthora nicotianae]
MAFLKRTLVRPRDRHRTERLGGDAEEGLLTTRTTSYITRTGAKGADSRVPCLEWDWKGEDEGVPRSGPLRGDDLWASEELLGRRETVGRGSVVFFLVKQEAFGIYKVTFGVIALVLVPTSACYIHDPDTKEEDRDNRIGSIF